jgi:hypothetical protein
LQNSTSIGGNSLTVLKDEYTAIPRTGNEYESSQKKKLAIDDSDADKGDKGTSLGSGRVEFLLYIDERVNHVIKMLSKHEAALGLHGG